MPQNCRLSRIDTPEPDSHALPRDRTNNVAIRGESRTLVSHLDRNDAVNGKWILRFDKTAREAHVRCVSRERLAGIAIENFGGSTDFGTRRSRLF